MPGITFIPGPGDSPESPIDRGVRTFALAKQVVAENQRIKQNGELLALQGEELKMRQQQQAMQLAVANAIGVPKQAELQIGAAQANIDLQNSQAYAAATNASVNEQEAPLRIAILGSQQKALSKSLQFQSEDHDYQMKIRQESDAEMQRQIDAEPDPKRKAYLRFYKGVQADQRAKMMLETKMESERLAFQYHGLAENLKMGYAELAQKAGQDKQTMYWKMAEDDKFAKAFAKMNPKDQTARLLAQLHDEEPIKGKNTFEVAASMIKLGMKENEPNLVRMGMQLSMQPGMEQTVENSTQYSDTGVNKSQKTTRQPSQGGINNVMELFQDVMSSKQDTSSGTGKTMSQQIGGVGKQLQSNQPAPTYDVTKDQQKIAADFKAGKIKAIDMLDPATGKPAKGVTVMDKASGRRINLILSD